MDRPDRLPCRRRERRRIAARAERRASGRRVALAAVEGPTRSAGRAVDGRIGAAFPGEADRIAHDADDRQPVRRGIGGVVEGDALADGVAGGEVPRASVSLTTARRRQARVGVATSRPRRTAAAASRNSRAAPRDTRRPDGRHRPRASGRRCRTRASRGRRRAARRRPRSRPRRRAAGAGLDRRREEHRPLAGRGRRRPCTETDSVSRPRGSKPGSMADGAEAAQRQAGADQQHQRQRHLGDDERVAQAAPRAVAGGRRARARRCRCRVRAACHAGTARRRAPVRTVETPTVNASVQPSRPCRRRAASPAAPSPQSARTPTAEDGQADDAAEAGEQHALGEELADQRGRAGAEREADRDSRCRVAARASSRCATLAQAISSTKPTAPSSTAGPGRGRRRRPSTQRRHGDAAVRAGKLPLEPRGNRGPSRARAVEVDAVAQPREDAQAAADARGRAAPSSGSGAQSSARVAQNGANLNDAGITPTIV